MSKCRVRQGGYTLVELIAVLVLVGVLAAVAVASFRDLSEEAESAKIQATYAALQSGYTLVYANFLLQGSPGLGENSNTIVDFNGIPVRFRNGQIRTTEDSNHVPSVPQNRNAAYTRLFFLFLNGAPGPIVRRNSNESGWAMLGNNNSCAEGVNPRRCWEYRRNGNRISRITYFARTGVFLLD